MSHVLECATLCCRVSPTHCNTLQHNVAHWNPLDICGVAVCQIALGVCCSVVYISLLGVCWIVSAHTHTYTHTRTHLQSHSCSGATSDFSAAQWNILQEIQYTFAEM